MVEFQIVYKIARWGAEMLDRGLKPETETYLDVASPPIGVISVSEKFVYFIYNLLNK